MAERQSFLIVDGHSVIFAWDELRALHATSPAAARRELENRLTQYQDMSGVGVVLVFDGKGERVQSKREEGGIQVMYADRGRTADDVIERLAAAHGKRHELTVVTDDCAEQETVGVFGAFAMGTEGFRDLLGASRRRFEERLRKRDKRDV